MHLSAHPVITDEEFKEVIYSERIAFETPYNAIFTLFCPVLGSHPTAREESIAEAQVRQLQWHRSDPTSHWIKVIDEDNAGKVAGAALWHVYDHNPYAKPPETETTCYWWPEGPKRAMADQAMDQLTKGRDSKMNKPHLLLEICFVEPQYRRQGAGNLLVRWGTDKADEMGLEAFVEATDNGKPLYAKHGFEYINEFTLDPIPPEKTSDLIKLQKDLQFRLHFMWRPVGGNFEKGVTVLPWEKQ